MLQIYIAFHVWVSVVFIAVLGSVSATIHNLCLTVLQTLLVILHSKISTWLCYVLLQVTRVSAFKADEEDEEDTSLLQQHQAQRKTRRKEPDTGEMSREEKIKRVSKINTLLCGLTKLISRNIHSTGHGAAGREGERGRPLDGFGWEKEAVQLHESWQWHVPNRRRNGGLPDEEEKAGGSHGWPLVAIQTII